MSELTLKKIILDVLGVTCIVGACVMVLYTFISIAAVGYMHAIESNQFLLAAEIFFASYGLLYAVYVAYQKLK